MAARLLVCPLCSRHVLDTAESCPFCAAPARPRSHNRIALPAIAALAMGVAAGCAYGPPPEEPSDGGPDDATADTQTADRVASDVDLGD